MATAVPLPPGEWQFCDANGVPYAGGLIYTYIPNTTTPKTTWQDPAQAIPNPNPIVLDSAGRCVIWGSGIYRLQFYDVNGNLIWDQESEAADVDYIASQLPDFVGDTGTGGTAGQVPAPPPGSAAAGDYLQANGSWGPLSVIVPALPPNDQAGLLFVPLRSLINTSGNSLVLTDAASGVSYANANAGSLTVSSDANIAWNSGVVTQVLIINPSTSGVLSLIPDNGVTLTAPGLTATSGTRALAANGLAVLSRIGADTWMVIGAGLS